MKEVYDPIDNVGSSRARCLHFKHRAAISRSVAVLKLRLCMLAKLKQILIILLLPSIFQDKREKFKVKSESPPSISSSLLTTRHYSSPK